MRWTSMELAALATRAVPGLSPTGVADAPDDARDFMAAVVVDGSGNRWRVRGPQHLKAAMRLETEVQVLRGFSTGIRAELPFRVPSVAGATRVGDMRVFVYNHLPGSSQDLAELTASDAELIEDLGRTVAAIHDLSEAVVDHADLPRYGAERLRQRRLNELDDAAATGKVPAALLRRWEHAMEDKSLWSFSPTVVHGDMHEDNLLVEGHRVVAVTGWTDLHIGDPADDLAWLIAAPQQGFTDAVLAGYRRHRSTAADEHILRRAALSAEFALAQWLVRGLSGENQQMTDEALGLLNQLAADIETYGGRPIALAPAAGEQAGEPADVQDSKPVRRAGAAATVAGRSEEASPGRPVTRTAQEYQQWLGPDPDDEPAVITDSDAAESSSTVDAFSSDAEPAADQPAGQQAPGVEQDPQTEQIPAYVEDHFDDGAADALAEPRPDTDSLPIQPDAPGAQRAKQKNFFPASDGSARSAQSARSASGSSAGSADSAEETDSGAAQDQTDSEAADSAGQSGTAESGDGDSATADSIYSRHPGLRPPGR